MTVPTLPLLVFAVAACPEPPRVSVEVVADLAPLSVATDFHLSEIRRLAQQAGGEVAHPPYGFYLSSVASTISVSIDNKAQDVCVGPIDIQVTMKLTNRRIEVAQELRADSCKFNEVVAHYQRRADADQAVFERYVTLVTATLTSTPGAALVDNLAAPSIKEHIAQKVQAIIEPVVAPLDTDRDHASKMVDTPAEVSRLEKACATRSRHKY
jgi:hypothetical protein